MGLFTRYGGLTVEVGAGPKGLSVAEALAGRAGTLCLGGEGTALWSPGHEAEGDLVLDARHRDPSDDDLAAFEAALEGRFMTARLVVLSGTNPETLRRLHARGAYAVVPGPGRNIPADIRRRVLTYQPTPNRL
jgi:hypothetical protein